MKEEREEYTTRDDVEQECDFRIERRSSKKTRRKSEVGRHQSQDVSDIKYRVVFFASVPDSSFLLYISVV